MECLHLSLCLHLSFHNVVFAGLFKGVALDTSLQISHLFYADDVVFVGQWCDSNLSTIIQVLDCFFQASGLRINLLRSKLIGIAVDQSMVDAAASNIGCMALNLPFSYLGIIIGGNMSRIKAWDNVINKVLCRLSKWKMKSLSIGGRYTLLKSVLGAAPIYFMSMFKAPIQVLKKLESIRNHFFNGVDSNVRKMMLVKWDNVLASKEKDGLGVSSFYALNRALTFKWIWRFRTHDSSLWSRVIKSIHGEDGKIGNSFKSGIVSNWNNITYGVTLLHNKGIDLLGYIKKKTRNGENTLFWAEAWKVANKMAHSSLVSSLRCNPRGGDREFSVASARNLIDDRTLIVVGSKTRWIKYVPIKVNILAWRIKLNNLPSRLNLSRRGLDLDIISCPSCNSAVESTNHIFFGCSMAKDLYKYIARWWNVSMMNGGIGSLISESRPSSR
ncbi:RNA-directed DNA polymerase, eukaryota, reverse transcriptase zinc-binding domain protein [Tanacetum coccineum]